MKTLLLAITLTGTSLTAFADKHYVDNKMTATHDCKKEPVAVIDGDAATITFKGACSDITINGNKATVKADSIKSLSINGNDSSVKVDVVETVSATGNNNSVAWKTGKPKTSSLGNGNKLGVAK